MQKPNDLNQSRIVLKQDSTLIAVIEMSLSSWLVAGILRKQVNWVLDLEVSRCRRAYTGFLRAERDPAPWRGQR